MLLRANSRASHLGRCSIISGRLRPGVDLRLGGARGSVDAAGAALAALGPAATLERGYAIVRRTRDGRIVRDPAEAPGGESLAIRVARGEVAATVDRPAGDG